MCCFENNSDRFRKQFRKFNINCLCGHSGLHGDPLEDTLPRKKRNFKNCQVNAKENNPPFEIGRKNKLRKKQSV